MHRDAMLPHYTIDRSLLIPSNTIISVNDQSLLLAILAYAGNCLHFFFMYLLLPRYLTVHCIVRLSEICVGVADIIFVTH